MKDISNFSFALLLGIFSAGPASAEIYKWVDENGETNFSERKPRTEIPVATVDIENTEATAPRESWQDQNAAFEERTETEAKTSAEASKVASVAADKQANCEQAKRRATTLERPRINEVAADGRRTRIGEDQRQEEIRKAAKAVSEFCN